MLAYIYRESRLLGLDAFEWLTLLGSVALFTSLPFLI
jgi:hypothetical protein